VTGYRRSFFLLVTALVWSFVLTRVTAIYFPTQGPVFFMPDMFSLSGTISAETQNALARYMAGEIRQNGLLPGTMAMPSLHVAMPFLVTVLLARELPRTLWLTVPWFVLNWASTVFLGWHYAVDGLGGVLIALIALGLAFVQQWAWDSAFGLEPVSRPRAISPDVTNTQAARASARATRSWLRRASRLSMSRSRRARGAVRAERRG
jgi:membrane-associated phospholipid phosphatase